MNSLAYSLATREFSDVLPTHLAAEFAHRRDGDLFFTEITSGSGSSLSLECTVRLSAVPSLTPQFESIFGSWSDAVEFVTCQDAVVAYKVTAQNADILMTHQSLQRENIYSIIEYGQCKLAAPRRKPCSVGFFSSIAVFALRSKIWFKPS